MCQRLTTSLNFFYLRGDKPMRIPKLSHLAQAALAYTAYGIFSVLPLDAASNIGGWLGRVVLSRIPMSQRAIQNLTFAMPELTAAHKKQIVREMWDNLARNVAEMPHVQKLVKQNRLHTIGFDHIEEALKVGKGVLIVGGHIGNWEVGPVICWDKKIPVTAVYRRPNNMLIDPLLRHMRRFVTPDLLPKGAKAAAGILKTLRQNGAVGLLIDQKMNTGGEMLRFFGQPAMTGLASAQLAIRTGAPLLVTTSVREKNGHFTFTVSPPIPKPDGLPLQDAALVMTQQINDMFEAHIRRYPGQWLWLHRRWNNRRKPWDTSPDEKKIQS